MVQTEEVGRAGAAVGEVVPVAAAGQHTEYPMVFQAGERGNLLCELFGGFVAQRRAGEAAGCFKHDLRLREFVARNQGGLREMPRPVTGLLDCTDADAFVIGQWYHFGFAVSPLPADAGGRDDDAVIVAADAVEQQGGTGAQGKQENQAVRPDSPNHEYDDDAFEQVGCHASCGRGIAEDDFVHGKGRLSFEAV